ncbi:hypothetical protein [Rhizobium sp. NXC24]|uniref:hypothetical protein n=1 Tax=Rhizobium sp. NXC24 TaxID=2048897 RepID=UPI000CF2AEDB|nr:hypothetical protein [Rhizobium sp. NXC24]
MAKLVDYRDTSANLTDYPDGYTHRKRSLVPPEAQSAVHDLGRGDFGLNDRITCFRDGLAQMDAFAVPRASDEIRRIGGLYAFYSGQSSNVFGQLRACPRLGWLMLFHGDGYIRQAALESLPDIPNSPFEFAAIVYRMNDWVTIVGQAASNYAARAFQKTDAGIVAESSFFLLEQLDVLGRLSTESRSLLTDTIYRPDVIAALRAEFLTIRSGRVARTLRQLLRRPEFDRYLEELARSAALPSVRAAAMETLLSGKATWLVGHTLQKVDKIYGRCQYIPEFGSRPLECIVDSESLLKMAAEDKAAHVRKVACDTLIALRHSASPEMDQVALKLAADRNAAVRSRAEFYVRQRELTPDPKATGHILKG